MTAKIIGHNVEVITLVNGLKWLEVLARIPAVSLPRNTAIKILARVRNMTYYNIISNIDIKIFTIRLIITLYFLGTSNYSYQTMSPETVSHDKDAMKPSNMVTGTIAKRVADAATWTWDFIKTPFA